MTLRRRPSIEADTEAEDIVTEEIIEERIAEDERAVAEICDDDEEETYSAQEAKIQENAAEKDKVEEVESADLKRALYRTKDDQNSPEKDQDVWMDTTLVLEYTEECK